MQVRGLFNPISLTIFGGQKDLKVGDLSLDFWKTGRRGQP